MQSQNPWRLRREEDNIDVNLCRADRGRGRSRIKVSDSAKEDEAQCLLNGTGKARRRGRERERETDLKLVEEGATGGVALRGSGLRIHHAG